MDKFLYLHGLLFFLYLKSCVGTNFTERIISSLEKRLNHSPFSDFQKSRKEWAIIVIKILFGIFPISKWNKFGVVTPWMKGCRSTCLDIIPELRTDSKIYPRLCIANIFYAKVSDICKIGYKVNQVSGKYMFNLHFHLGFPEIPPHWSFIRGSFSLPLVLALQFPFVNKNRLQ